MIVLGSVICVALEPGNRLSLALFCTVAARDATWFILSAVRTYRDVGCCGFHVSGPGGTLVTCGKVLCVPVSLLARQARFDVPPWSVLLIIVLKLLVLSTSVEGVALFKG